MSRIDLERVKRALARLDAVATARPEVFEGRDEQAWAQALKGSEAMGQATSWQAAVRFPLDLVGRIDTFREAVAAANPGMKVSRSDAIRLLVTRALDAEGAQKKATARR